MTHMVKHVKWHGQMVSISKCLNCKERFYCTFSADMCCNCYKTYCAKKKKNRKEHHQKSGLFLKVVLEGNAVRVKSAPDDISDTT